MRETHHEFMANGTRYYLETNLGGSTYLYRQPSGQSATYFGSVPNSNMFAWDSRVAYMFGRIGGSNNQFMIRK